MALCALLALCTLGACGEAIGPIDPPVVPELRVFTVLDPDRDTQLTSVASISWKIAIEELEGEIRRGGVPVVGPVAADSVWYACVDRYGTFVGTTGGPPHCVAYDFVPEHGATYTVAIAAEDRPTATGATTVPGDFRVVAASAKGDPPGTEGIVVRWTRSQAAYRYVVALRATTPHMDGATRYIRGWWVATADTTLATTIRGQAAKDLEGRSGPWYVDVYAVDRALYEILTSGSSHDVFPVPPAQNVEGGYGVVGSWVRRSIELER